MKRRLALGTASALAVVTGACSSVTHNDTAPKESSTSTSAVVSVTTTVPSSTQPVTSTTAFGSTDIRGINLLSQVGEGHTTTRSFVVPTGTKQWDLAWSYVCPGKVPSGSLYYNFAFEVYRGSSLDTKDTTARGSAATGQGTQRYTDSGRFSLHVGAQEGCTWAFHVIIPSG